MAYVEWKNIDNPDFSNVSDMIQTGGNNLNTAINTLTNVANKINQGQIDAQKANLIKQAMANSSDPEQLSRFFAEATNNPAFNKLRPGDWMQAQQFQNDLLNTNKLQGEVADATWARNTKKDTADFATAIKAAIASGDPNRIAQANQALLNASQGKNFDPSQLFFGNENEAKQNIARLTNLNLDNKAKQQALDDRELKSKLAADFYSAMEGDTALVPYKAFNWLQNISKTNPNAFSIARDVVKEAEVTPQYLNKLDPNAYKETLIQQGNISKINHLSTLAKDLNNSSGEVINLNRPLVETYQYSSGDYIPNINTAISTDPRQNLLSRLTDKTGVNINGKFIPITKDNIDDFEIVSPKGSQKLVVKFKPEVIKEILEKENNSFRANPLENTLEENQNRINAISSYAGNKLIKNSRAGSVIKDFNTLISGLENAKPHEVVTMVANSLKNSGYNDANVDYVADALKDINNALPENLRNRVPMNVLALAFLSTLDPEESLIPWQIFGNNGEAPENEVDDAVQFISSYANNPNAFSELMSQEEFYTNLVKDAEALKQSMNQNNDNIKTYTYALNSASSERDKAIYAQLLQLEQAKQIQLLIQLVQLEAKQRGY